MKITEKTLNSVETYIGFNKYMRASQSESPDEKCKDCSALFTFKGKTKCYAYEQQRFKDKNEFHPRRDFNCTLFDNTGALDYIVSVYKKAHSKRSDPENDPVYQKCLKEENDYYESLNSPKQKAVIRNFEESDDREEWDDPDTYACCGDWEDEPENCYHCADDECPMNKW